MELQLFGINHKTSNVSEREKFIINESNQILLDNHLKEFFKQDIESFYGISTCNRTEIYFIGKKNIGKSVLKEVFKVLKISDVPLKSFYFLDNHDALVHMSKVASGIDSQVLGEQEIFGQFKSAFKKAKDIGIVGRNLAFLSDKVIEISKKARTETNIGLNSLSVSGLALKLVKNIFENPNEQNVLVVGAGSLAQSVIDNLYKKGINNIKSVNRTVRKIELDDNYEILSSSLESLHDQLEIADIVIASSSTDLPLIGKGAIENALKIRKNKPMLLIDLGVPRNIEEEIRNIDLSKYDPKSRLQELCLKKNNKLPEYNFVSKTGPEHEPIFKISVNHSDDLIVIGEGKNKQDAEINAAKLLLKKIENKKI